MDREAFIAKYRPHLLLFITEAWAVRKDEPTALGLTLDRHHQRALALLNSIYGDLEVKVATQANGRPQSERKP